MRYAHFFCSSIDGLSFIMYYAEDSRNDLHIKAFPDVILFKQNDASTVWAQVKHNG